MTLRRRSGPSVSSTQMRRIERIAVERLKIPVLLLMENAGRSVAEAARQLLQARRGRKVIVLSGGGHNGGDGIVAARWLKGWGYLVSVYWLKHPSLAEGDAARHYQIAKRVGVPFFAFARIAPARRVKTLREADLLIDALMGTGATGHLKVPMYDAIAAMNYARKPVLSVDLPSGLDPDTGEAADIAARAALTVTIAAPKTGLLKAAAKKYVGKLIVADIGIPDSSNQRRPR